MLDTVPGLCPTFHNWSCMYMQLSAMWMQVRTTTLTPCMCCDAGNNKKNSTVCVCTWSELSMLHAQHKTCSLGSSQQSSDIAQPTAKTDPAHFDSSTHALWALNKFVSGVGSLSAQGSPQTCPATQVTRYNACPNALSALVLQT